VANTNTIHDCHHDLVFLCLKQTPYTICSFLKQSIQYEIFKNNLPIQYEVVFKQSTYTIWSFFLNNLPIQYEVFFKKQSSYAICSFFKKTIYLYNLKFFL
jgi:hypothetical protein